MLAIIVIVIITEANGPLECIRIPSAIVVDYTCCCFHANVQLLINV